MTWAKIDESFTDHPKVAGLSDKAFRLHVSAICYSSRMLTDGEVPVHILPRIGATSRLSKELHEAGLWETTSRGSYVIHDYLEYNPSRSEVEAERTKRQAAGKAGGLASGRVRSTKDEASASLIVRTDGERIVERSVQTKTNPDPTRPVPDASNEASHQRGASLSPLLRDRANSLAMAVGDRWVDEETWESIVQLCEEFSDFEIEAAKRENRKVTPSRRPFPGNLREFLSKPTPRPIRPRQEQAEPEFKLRNAWDMMAPVEGEQSPPDEDE